MEQISVMGMGKAENGEDSITVRIKEKHLNPKFLYYEIIPGGIEVVSELDGSSVKISLIEFMGYGFKSVGDKRGLYVKKKRKLKFKQDDK